MRDAGIGDVRDPNGPESRPRHLGAKCQTRGPNDYRRNRMLQRWPLAANCVTISFERVSEGAWPDGRVGGARHLPPRKVRAPWADCQVTPGPGSTRAVATDSATENTPPT